MMMRPAFCASLRSRMHMDMSQATFCAEIYRINAGRSSRRQNFVRACGVECTWTCHKRDFARKLTGKMPCAYPRDQCFVRACAVENAHGHVTSDNLRGNLKGKCRTLIPPPAFCASLRSRMHMDMSQEAFCTEINRENAVCVCRDQCFARACAVEMHMDMSQEAFCQKFTGKMPDASDTTSIEHRPLTVTIRTPQGEKRKH